jgi:hypothetical protein
MSFSFNARGATKQLAVAAALAKFDEVAAQDPSQASAKATVAASVKAIVRQLPNDETRDVHVTVSGYVVSQAGAAGRPEVTNAKVAASVLLAVRQQD